MKYIELNSQDEIKETIGDETRFFFDCKPILSCYKKCCQNQNIFLYPYDVIRLKNRLGISSDVFLEDYVNIVLREDSFFPEVLLAMSSELPENPCLFLEDSGCSVYADRPEACRMFPLEHGFFFDARTYRSRRILFLKPPHFCDGQNEEKPWTPNVWIKNQGAEVYNQMSRKWYEIQRLFQNDPWAGEGVNGKRGKMAFMASYNIDKFRDFLFNSSFLKRYKIASAFLDKAKRDDCELLKLGCAWIELFVWGKQSSVIRLKK